MSLKNVLNDWSHYRKGIEEGGFYDYEHMWGMVIDLNKCTGCNACAVSCYSENNLAVVGKDRMMKGQGLHWLRMERYWDEPDMGGDDKEFQERGGSFLPMMCQQCNAATCEVVCPVAATYHTPDGLNAQVYNRCIGSRYCSNNCPYRLRYFNFYSYYEESWPEPLNQQLNPDLSVRDKGVMEKCTFCIQRIRTGKDKAAREGREVKDGDVVTACAQSCPTQAIIFGDLLDKDAKVTKLWKSHQVELGKTKQDKSDEDLRGYRVLEGLNTDPCVMYLDRVREV